jgi:hypothetical protein
MTMPPEQIDVECLKCGRVYQSWYRPSINLGLDNFSAEYLEAMSTATNPQCPDGVHELAGSPMESSPM